MSRFCSARPSGGLVSGPAWVLAADAPVPVEACRMMRLRPREAGSISSRVWSARARHEPGTAGRGGKPRGAGGNLGAEVAAKAAPDGYTLFMATPSHAINRPLSQAELRLDQDFAPVGLVMTDARCNPSLPAKSVKDLIALPGRAQGAQLRLRRQTAMMHLAGELSSRSPGWTSCTSPTRAAARRSWT